MPVAAPADKRFRRSHVHPARKRRAWPWRTLIVLLLVGIGVFYGVSRAARFALSAEALAITRIEVTGTNHMARAEVLERLDGLRGANMVTADLDGWKTALLDAPWVADVAIRRVFPGTVSVVISERQPMAIGRINGALYLIDRHGYVIDEFGPSYAEFDFPIVDGLAASPGGEADRARAALAGRVLADFQRRPDLAKRLSQVDVSNARDAVVVLKDDTTRLQTGDEHFVDRVQTYLDLEARLREHVPQFDYDVDLRHPNKVVLKPRGTAGR